MKTFRNANFTRRNYECTNIVACVAEQAPKDGRTWIEVSDAGITGLQPLMIIAGVRYYGYT